MNSQFTPGLSESFIRQEHQRLLKVAANARLARQATAGRPRRSLFSLNRNPAKNASRVEAPQPSASTAATVAVLTAFLAVQFALWIAF